MTTACELPTVEQLDRVIEITRSQMVRRGMETAKRMLPRFQPTAYREFLFPDERTCENASAALSDIVQGMLIATRSGDRDAAAIFRQVLTNPRLPKAMLVHADAALPASSTPDYTAARDAIDQIKTRISAALTLQP